MTWSELGGNKDVNTLRLWQKRTHCCGHIVAHDVSGAAQTGKHLLRTQNAEQNQKHFLFPQQMLHAWANGETFVSAKCPEQCVLFCQGLKLKSMGLVRSNEELHIHEVTSWQTGLVSKASVIQLLKPENRYSTYYDKTSYPVEVCNPIDRSNNGHRCNCDNTGHSFRCLICTHSHLHEK